MAEEGANPRAGDADGVAGGRVARQHENVGKQLPHGLGFDVAAIWRAGFPALFVPIGEKLLIRRMLHTLSLLRAGCWNGTFLSRFRACADPGFVVQKGLCSVHAEAGRARGFCVVNVKLTLGLARASDLLLSRASELRPVLPGSGRTQRRRTNWPFARGGVGLGPRSLREAARSVEGGLSQSPPFSFFDVCTVSRVGRVAPLPPLQSSADLRTPSGYNGPTNPTPGRLGPPGVFG